jgi:Na+/melibiose symporter-like transporter
MTVQQLIPILQIAIGPVVLISGVGLLILSMTNRLGRVIDRGRSLVRELPEIPERNHERVIAQLRILSRRANLLQQAIIFAVFCVLFAAVLIITLFFTAAFAIEDAWLIGGLFIGSLASLILSLVAFIRELNQSLMAFHLDVGDWPKPKP